MPPITSATPAPGTAIVTGVALWEREGNQPATEIDLYLAEVSDVIEGQLSLAKLDPTSSPKATMYDTGAFFFNDVPPGSYSLAASISPANSALLRDQDTGDELTISVEPDQVVDVGTIYLPEIY